MRPLIAFLALTAAACSRPPPLPATLCVVRHAEAFKNLDPPPAGLDPVGLDTLTPRGEVQALAVRDALGAGPVRVSSSPAGRARQTAALIAGGADTVEIVAALRPLDGDIEWSERSQAWRAGDDLRPAGGESLADGRARVAALLDALRAKLGPGERAVWVTHGDIASLVLGELRGTPLLERPTRDTLDTGGHACLPLRRDAVSLPRHGCGARKGMTDVGPWDAPSPRPRPIAREAPVAGHST